MIPAPSPLRLHLAALVLVLVAAVWALGAQTRRSPAGGASAPLAPRAPAAAQLLFGGRLDLNRADAEDLAALPGIGPVRAGRILAARAARGGRFASVDDLADVPGIGPVTLERLRPHVRVAP